MGRYIFNKVLETYLNLAVARTEHGMGAVLLLTGIPGGGKTSFAKAVAERLGGTFHKYQCAPDRERDLLYRIDVDGVLKREAGWLPGPAWAAFEASKERYAVLLIDELDKANPNFDAFLLELLEEFKFRSAQGETIEGEESNLVVILTSNGRRSLRPEVLRRCQRVEVPFPERPRLDEIVQQIAGVKISQKLLDLVIRIGAAIRSADAENGPSPKEMALLIVDILNLVEMEIDDSAIWREVAASWLVKEGGPETVDKLLSYNWAAALRTEASRA